MDDAISRLRERAQNEATCFALNDECKRLRQQLGLTKADLMLAQGDAVRLTEQLAECKSKWEHFENSVAEKSMQCLSLEKELSECQKDGKHYAHEYLIAKDALAECQRERDAYKAKAVIADIPMSDVEARLKEQLATVTAERDELVAAMKDAYPYETHLADGCDCPWCKALAKVGADKTGEK